MQSEMPFYEGPEDALKAAVQALGGAKKVGPMLWPDKTVDNAARSLLDCLNPSRSEKLDYSQTMLLMVRAREANYHAPFMWFAQQAGYEARPVTPAEEEDRLLTVLETASKTAQQAMNALEQMRRLRAA